MHTYEENPCMYAYLCSNALEADCQMVSIYVAQSFLAKLLQLIEYIKKFFKSQEMTRQANGKRTCRRLNMKRCHANFTLLHENHGTYTVSPGM